MTLTSPESTSAPPAPQLARGRPRMQELGLIIVIVCLGLFLWLASGNVTLNLPAKEIHGVMHDARQVQENKFLRTDNLIPSVLVVMSWMAVMSIGQTFVIITGGIDISVGSIMGLSAMLTALALLKFPPDASPWVAIPVGMGVSMGVGLLCGILNGSLVVGLRMHPFIVTLATLSIFRWGSLKLGEMYGASQPFGRNPIPTAFTDHFIEWQMPVATHGGQHMEYWELTPIIIMVLVLIVSWIYLRHTVWGRETYAVGGNEEAARFSGIRLAWVKMRVYAISGLSAGIAGMLTCGFYKSASTDTGKGYELNVVAAAVVGGASLTGGRGTALGAVLGMLVIQLIEDGIYVLGPDVNVGFATIQVKKADTQLIYGIAILIAVAVDQFSMYLQSRRSARARSGAH